MSARVDAVRLATVGREIELIQSVGGLADAILNGRSHPCPWCGGVDRFAVMKRGDKVICRKCAPKGADVFEVVMRYRGCKFTEAVEMVAEHLQTASAVPRRQPPKPRPFKTANDAVKALERRLGKRAAEWVYRNAASVPVGLICRWNTEEGKTIRPVSFHADGWRIEGMPQPFPLYNLPRLLESELVIVTEGEKAADAAMTHGFTATTSPHGAKSASCADWSPLAGKRVVILPDNDADGEVYAAAVVAMLLKVRPVVEWIEIVRLPDLPAGGDIADWAGNLSMLDCFKRIETKNGASKQ